MIYEEIQETIARCKNLLLSINASAGPMAAMLTRGRHRAKYAAAVVPVAIEAAETAALTATERQTLSEAKGAWREANSLAWEVVLKYEWVADSTAARYGQGYLSMEDRRQEARIGVLKAAQRFARGKGSFPAFAAWWARAEVTKAIDRGGRAVTLPANLSAAIRAEKRLREGGARGSISKLLQLPALGAALVSRPIRFDAVDRLGERLLDRTASNQPSPEQQAARRERRRLVWAELDALVDSGEATHTDARILTLRAGLEGRSYYLHEIGAAHGCSAEWARLTCIRMTSLLKAEITAA